MCKSILAQRKTRLATSKTHLANGKPLFAKRKTALAIVKRRSRKQKSRSAIVRPAPEVPRPTGKQCPQALARSGHRPNKPQAAARIPPDSLYLTPPQPGPAGTLTPINHVYRAQRRQSQSRHR